MLAWNSVILNIFDYTDAAAFLRDIYGEKRRINPRFSLRAWSKQLGIKNPSTLSRILHGDREIGLRLVQKLARGLKLTERQKRYFELMVVMRRIGCDYSLHLNALKTMEQRDRKASLSADQFAFISDWYHLPIFEMTSLAGFRADPHWISARLGRTVSPDLCADALLRLNRLGLIKISAGNKVERFSDKTLMGGDWGIPSQAMRKFHKHMIEIALQSVEGLTMEQRTLESVTLSLRIKDLPLAKKIIREASHRLSELAVSREADEIFQVSTQLFQLTFREPEERV